MVRRMGEGKGKKSQCRGGIKNILNSIFQYNSEKIVNKKETVVILSRFNIYQSIQGDNQLCIYSILQD